MNRQSGISFIIAGLAGLIFGLGLSVSGMVNPARVLGFLNIASGHWDPSLAFVLGGALLVALPGVILQRRMAKPLFDRSFHLPEKRDIDGRLVAGSLLFGIGWGLAGFCPGPAIAALGAGAGAAFIFVTAMATGMVLHDRWLARRIR